MTTFKVSPEYREGVFRGVRMPEKPHWGEADMQEKEEYEYNLAQARKDALPFEDQELVEDLLMKHINPNPQGRYLQPQEQLYSSLSWEVEEVHVCTNEEAIREDQFCDVCDCKRVLRIVTKP